LKVLAVVLGILGLKMLDRLEGRSGIGVGVRNCVLSLASTDSVLNSTKPAAWKLFLIVSSLNVPARACGYTARKSSLSI
jgi:hypothetical protein